MAINEKFCYIASFSRSNINYGPMNALRKIDWKTLATNLDTSCQWMFEKELQKRSGCVWVGWGCARARVCLWMIGWVKSKNVCVCVCECVIVGARVSLWAYMCMCVCNCVYERVCEKHWECVWRWKSACKRARKKRKVTKEVAFYDVGEGDWRVGDEWLNVAVEVKVESHPEAKDLRRCRRHNNGL